MRLCDYMEDVKTMCKLYSQNRGHPLVAENSAKVLGQFWQPKIRPPSSSTTSHGIAIRPWSRLDITIQP